jgi:hypothetical protein
MKKPTFTYYNAALAHDDNGVTATCKCWQCGKLNTLRYKSDQYRRLLFHRSDLCKHVIGWRHDSDITWLKMRIRDLTRTRTRRSPK